MIARAGLFSSSEDEQCCDHLPPNSPSELDSDPELCLRLEHVIVSHQRLPEWGSPKPPMTPEALIVHYADDLDAKFEMMSAALSNAPAESPFTSHKNALHYRIYRGSAT